MEYEGRSMFERFNVLRVTQQELERRGYHLYPVEREHTEGVIISPLLQRIRTQIKKRGFEKVAGRVAVTFSGYANDEREIFQIPEIRGYWRAVDGQFPEWRSPRYCG